VTLKANHIGDFALRQHLAPRGTLVRHRWRRWGQICHPGAPERDGGRALGKDEGKAGAVYGQVSLIATSLRRHVPSPIHGKRPKQEAPGAAKLGTCAMERVAMFRTSGRRLLHRCHRDRPVVHAVAVSSSARRLPSTSFPSRGYSALPCGGERFLAAAAPLHCVWRYWSFAAPRLARRLFVPAVSTSPSPARQGENGFCWNFSIPERQKAHVPCAI
jgi:hypothetical protein